MILFIFLLLCSPVLLHEDFTDTITTMSQLYDYSIDVSSKEGKVFLKATPHFEGFAVAWFYVDKDIVFTSEDVLELVIKVNDNKARLRYFCRIDGREVYFAGEEIISSNEQWQEIEIPFKEAKPFYSSNYPYALTPDKKPCLYIFIDNELPGNFDVEIDRVSVFRPGSDEGEK